MPSRLHSFACHGALWNRIMTRTRQWSWGKAEGAGEERAWGGKMKYTTEVAVD